MTPLFASALLRTQSDERLLTLVGAGQERAFEAIVHRYRKPLERYCARALSRSQAEDVVQHVLLKAWQALSSGAEVRSLKPWLYRIAQTTIIETVQRSRFDYEELARSLAPAKGPDSELEQRAVIRKTLMGLAALPETQREALLRTAVDGQSRAEIADALGLSEGAVRQLLYRARSNLRVVATGLTPLPLLMWIARPAEAAGMAGLAKASAIVAGASVAAAGPVAIHELPLNGPEKTRAHLEKPAAKRPQSKLASVVPSRPAVQRSSPSEETSGSRESGAANEHGREAAEDRGERDQERARSIDNAPERETEAEDHGDDQRPEPVGTPRSGPEENEETSGPEATSNEADD